MTADFDCAVSGSPCTNRDGTVDDSWSGTLDAGEHKIVVYPDGGGSGNYTLTISAGAPSTRGSTGTRTQVTTLVDVSRMAVSTSQTHSFTLSGPAEVDVALTALTIDFDCQVGSGRCTNRGGTRDDSWSGDLAAGSHSVEVSKRTIRALACTAAVAGAVLLPSRPLSAQTEVEIIHADEDSTLARFRDDDGVLVERFAVSRNLGGNPFTEDSFFDEYGNVERMVTRYPDGRSVTEQFAYGRPSPDGGERFPLARGRNMSREQMERFLSRLPSLPGTSRKTELGLSRGRPRPHDGAASEPVHPWGHHWKERGDGFARTTFRLLHQEMEVESARLGEKRLDEEWLRITDSRGGLRHDRLTKTAHLEQHCNVRYDAGERRRQRSPWSCDQVPSRAVASYDAVGRIAHVVTNDEGYPTETWYGETLVARYHYAQVDGVRPLPPHGGLGDFWVELIDARTGKRLLDSRSLPTTSARPLFSAGGSTIKSGVIESVDDEIFAVVYHDVFTFRYALLPLGEGPVWRRVQAAGTEASELRSVVHYTDDRLRIEFQFDHTDLVVEAPRHGSSPIKVTWPKDISLPFGAGEEVGALSAPSRPLPPPPEEGLVPPPGP